MVPSGQKWDGAGKWGGPADRKAGGAGEGIRHRGIKRSEPLQKCVPPAGPMAVEQGEGVEELGTLAQVKVLLLNSAEKMRGEKLVEVRKNLV